MILEYLLLLFDKIINFDNIKISASIVNKSRVMDGKIIIWKQDAEIIRMLGIV